MTKVFLYTYWIMWGKESGERSKLIDKAWLTSVLPPFYKGVGLSFRIGAWNLRVGICHPRSPVTVDEYAYVGDFDANLDALVGYELDEAEMSAWGS